VYVDLCAFEIFWIFGFMVFRCPFPAAERFKGYLLEPWLQSFSADLLR
jgi:hypothetical protein